MFLGLRLFFCRGQGVNILFNLFGGPIINAAYGIANQVNSAIVNLVNNFTTALNPSIIKSYATGQKDYMMSLVYQGARFSYYLVLLFTMPIFLETEYVTLLWLDQIPDYSVAFIRLMLLYSLIDSLSKTIMAGVHASGNIKLYQIVVGSFQIIILPVAYYLLKIGYSPNVVLFFMVIIDILAVFARMIIAKRIFGLSFSVYLIQVIVRVILVTVGALVIPLVLRLYLDDSLCRFFIVVIVSLITTSLSILYVGCTYSERQIILKKIQGMLYRVKKE